jgi:FdhD protein
MTRTLTIHRYEDGEPRGARPDDVAMEEPLEIRVEGEPLVVAMRTPGRDRELAAGWLLSEGIVLSAEEIADIVERPGEDTRAAMVDVMLRDASRFVAIKHRRNVVTNSSCGLCGAASVAQVLRDFPKIESAFLINAKLLLELPARLAENQPVFQRTGGLHACALFDDDGALVALREDVGRHNALDKLLGWALLEGKLPLSNQLLLLSGRVSVEMMQKALTAGIPIVAAIGAPSSLAVELARDSGQTLAAFLRGRNFNIYTGGERIRGAGVV